jgi:hypothetical protein
MSNIFNSISRYFGPRELNPNPEMSVAQGRETNKGLITLGYSVVYFDPKSESRSINYENL